MRSAWHAGIDDYLRIPWSPEELLLRIRGPRPRQISWDWNGSLFTLEGSNVKAEGRPALTLTALEAALVRQLVERRGIPVSRSVLAWSAGCSDGRVIDTLISRLRKRFDSHFGHGLGRFQCIRNVGYRLS